MAMAMKSASAKRSKSTQLDLQNRRMARGLSLETIADSTKISIRFLRAIEDEDFEKLPGGIFNTSYLRQYAAAIQFDETKLLAFYSRKTSPAVTDGAMVADGSRGFLKWLRVPATAGR
jgi:cytoskeletal protein RodZ